jgi:hypothetical protein
MSLHAPSTDSPAPAGLDYRIDGACNRFEVAWRSGPPRLEDFVEGFLGQERLALLCELAHVDLAHRRRRRLEGRLEDYAARFPELAGVLLETTGTTAGGLLAVQEGDAVGPSQFRRIDELCDEFETAWQAGERPCLEEYLARVDAGDRPALQADLLRLEAEYRGAAGTARRTPAPPAGEHPEVPGYKILSVLDRGGMGVVYRATDHALGREVAVKVLLEGFAPDSSAARRFLKEARITAQLQHPAIPPVHQVGALSDGQPFLAMKLIKGQTLEALLREREPGAGQWLAVFEQICQAVAYAHSRGVIHRDLKPRNVMVGAFGEVQVMDWGLAKILPDASAPRPAPPGTEGQAQTAITPPPDSDGSHTQAGSIIGTLAFMPPEQAGGEIDKVDRRADVFGLGAILAVILTGQPPNVGRNAEAVRLMAIRGQTADCLARLDACGAEPALVALCKRCLAFEPDDRPADAGAVAAEVARLRAAAEERARHAEVEAALEARASAVLKGERDRALLGLTVQAAERLESDLKQLEQVGQALAVLGRQADLEDRHPREWMRGMVERDERLFGLALAFEPGQGLRGAATTDAGDYCLYVFRGDEGPEDAVREMYLLPPQYPYRQRSWYAEPRGRGRPTWTPVCYSLQEYHLDLMLFSYLTPIRRQGEVVGVAAADVSLSDFFGKTNPLGNWRERLSPEDQRRSYWFVFSHTLAHWDPDKPLTDEQRRRGAPGWDREPSTGAILEHPRRQFPLRLGDLPGRAADFDELVERMLRRRPDGSPVEQSGVGTATDPDTTKRSTFLFARVPSVEWTFVLVIEEAAAP